MPKAIANAAFEDEQEIQVSVALRDAKFIQDKFVGNSGLESVKSWVNEALRKCFFSNRYKSFIDEG